MSSKKNNRSVQRCASSKNSQISQGRNVLRQTLSALCAALTALCLLTACHTKERTLTIAATPVPHSEILEAIKSDLEERGVHLKIVEVDDYNLPNRLLFEKQVEANFFQHKPFLDEQNLRFGYNLKPLVAVHIEPLGIYSKRIPSLDAVKERAIVAIPNDPTNESRALYLLQKASLIKLRPSKIGLVTIYDIEENPKNLKIEEVDAAFLPRILSDVDLAVIPANFALQGNLHPSRDALALESTNSPYANIVVVREEDQGSAELEELKKALTSEKLRRFIQEKYKGAILPAL